MSGKVTRGVRVSSPGGPPRNTSHTYRVASGGLGGVVDQGVWGSVCVSTMAEQTCMVWPICSDRMTPRKLSLNVCDSETLITGPM